MKVIDRKLLSHLDWVTVIIVLALFSIGIISIASIMASPFTGTEQTLSDYMQRLNLEYVERQLVNFAVGLAGLIILLVMDYHMLKSFTKPLYIGIVGVLFVLVALGKTSRGVAGWFILDSIDRAIQPGELTKVILIVVFAKVIAAAIERDGKLLRFVDILKILGLCLLPTALVFYQPDFGTGFVFICIMVGVLFVSGISWKYIAATVVAGGALAPLAYMFLLDDSQKARIQVFLNPEMDPLGKGYHVIQSKLFIGSGQFAGRGLFSESTLAQLKYIPERHTDFIFSGMVEAMGFIGGAAVIILFFALLIRWFYVAGKSDDAFGMCLVAGAASMILAHVFENIGMTMGLMPVTGIPLPFISYGGSNLLTSLLCVGLVLNVYMRRTVSKYR